MKRLRELIDKRWSKKHGIVGAIIFHSGLRGSKLRRRWKKSVDSFDQFMKDLKKVK